MIRLIATDLDGTLLEKDGTLPEGIFETVRELKALGIRFAACSGRQYDNLRRLFRPVSDQMAYVCENGGISFLDGEVAGMIPMPEELAWEVIREMEATEGMNLLISGPRVTYMKNENRAFTDDIVYRLRNTSAIVSSWEDLGEPMLKVACQKDGGVADIAPALLEKWSHRLTATVSGFDWFDFTYANKGMGMRELMKHMGVQKEEVAAFGDNFNDETMLDSVGHAFIMQHSDPALHKPQYHICQKVLPVLRALVETKGDMDAALRLISE